MGPVTSHVSTTPAASTKVAGWPVVRAVHFASASKRDAIHKRSDAQRRRERARNSTRGSARMSAMKMNMHIPLLVTAAFGAGCDFGDVEPKATSGFEADADGWTIAGDAQADAVA